MAVRNVAEAIVVVAPVGADAKNIAHVLKQADIGSVICASLADAAECIDRGIGALLMTEEALSPTRNTVLTEAFDRQPAWSDIPLIIVTSGGSIHRWATLPDTALGSRCNVTLVARPLQASTLVAAAQAVLRARRRQYEIRDLLTEREALLTSLETRVQERTVKLQELVAELESFSYSVSHDLRAPLRVMAGYARIVLEDYAADLRPEARSYVERIAISAERMDLLTQDVLAYTRLARGEVALEPVDLDKLIEETIDQYPQLAVARSSIVLKKPFARVLAHSPSLIQALSNLIGNAIKFARPDAALQIVISTKRRGQRVKIAVQDNGVGIEANFRPKVFRIFERAVGRDVPGTGIGLAIVKKAAERMGGTVGLVSEPGQGSTFWIELAAAPV